MKILTHEGLQYFYNQIAAKFSTKEQTAEAIEEAVGNAGVGTVTSVNGKTGVVQLSASDVGALPASTQIPSIAGLATETYVDNKVASMVDSAPETLNTLNELAAALGDDPNFATTVATEIGGKVNKSGDTMTGQLTASGLSIKSDGWAMLRFYNAEGTETGGFYSNQDARQLNFFSKDKSGYNDYFKLPYPSGLTADGYYDILTTKNPVTIAQGGTGATTAQDAAHSLIRGNAIAPANIEFWPASDTATHGGYLDFHFNQASDDYTSRIIESAKGVLDINNVAGGKVRLGTVTAGTWQGSAIGLKYGGTGATTRAGAINNLFKIGTSPVTSTANDTVTKWAEFGNGVAWYGTDGQLIDQPGAYGALLNISAVGSEISQLWFTAPNGAVYHRGANGSGWSGTWTKFYDTSNKPTPAEIGALSTNGGTLTGALLLAGGLYAEGDTLDATQYALDMNNSNIIGANGIYMNDASDGITEGIHFYRSTTTYDSIWAANGKLYFTPNRPLKGAGTAYTVYHTGNKPSAADIGAVSKSGDTMTGDLITTTTYAKGNYPAHGYMKADGTPVVLMQVDTNHHRLAIHQKRGGTSVWESNEAYFLPAPNLDQTATVAYDILTSKNPVTIAQGGTGATEKGVACRNLMNGVNIEPASIELYPSSNKVNHGGFIDFHYNGSTSDYTSRIIEDSENYLNINAFEGGKVKLGRVTAGTWNGSAIPIANGGTGAVNEVTAANNLKIQSLGHGTDIPKNANLNTYTTIGNYRCGSTSIGATITNCPVANAFTLQVYASTGTSTSAPTTAGWAYFLQKLTTIDGAQYYRTITFSNSTTASFGDWIEIYDSANKPTAADVGALALTGGTVSGAVTINNTLTATKVIGAVYA